jgi:Cys-tRNA(Pro)/Cys-tRNA(Cys) deacylase
MAVIPGDTELDLKALAAASGDRKIHLVAVLELQKLTGYIRGGVTALAAKKTFPVYADKSIEQCLNTACGQCTGTNWRN